MRTLFSSAKTLFLQSARHFARDNSPQTAAAISYYVLFSLFPLLIFVVGIVGIVLRDQKLQQDVVNFVLDNIPLSQGEGRNSVTDAVRGVAGVASGGLSIIGLLGMAWAASAMFGVIRTALNRAYEVKRTRPFVPQKLLDIAMVLALGLFFLASIGATAALRIIRDRSEQLASIGRLAEATGVLWDLASFLLPLVFSFVAFTVLYTVVPAERRRPLDVWPGALLAAVLFEVVKISFSFYLEHFGNYNLVFGSLGALVAFLFWVYLSANIMLFGAEMADVYPRVRSGAYVQAQPGQRRSLREQLWREVKKLFVRVPPEPQPPGEQPGESAGVRGRRM